MAHLIASHSAVHVNHVGAAEHSHINVVDKTAIHGASGNVSHMNTGTETSHHQLHGDMVPKGHHGKSILCDMPNPYTNGKYDYQRMHQYWLRHQEWVRHHPGQFITDSSAVPHNTMTPASHDVPHHGYGFTIRPEDIQRIHQYWLHREWIHHHPYLTKAPGPVMPNPDGVVVGGGLVHATGTHFHHGAGASAVGDVASDAQVAPIAAQLVF